ncbi:DUF3265 domain-containing protein [Vibrio parahaemolyticus]|nr:DUF3265 domain-containing protein [Vibrio parahaemolyticus]
MRNAWQFWFTVECSGFCIALLTT